VEPRYVNQTASKLYELFAASCEKDQDDIEAAYLDLVDNFEEKLVKGFWLREINLQGAGFQDAKSTGIDIRGKPPPQMADTSDAVRRGYGKPALKPVFTVMSLAA
jgi:hypothetical protein